MNIIKRLLTSAALCAALLTLTPPAARAGDYAVGKTFWSFNGTWTNTATAVTNLSAAIDVTAVTDFSLQVIAKATNGGAVGAGGFSIVWETSLDGSNYSVETNASFGRSMGWFAVPVSTNAITTTWVTNITVDAIGYWRIRSVTNNCNMNYTNISILGYVKPKRQNRDY